ncbi:hypothetical protein IW140_000182 [Coemansia sp. RSA 1813]|nr:hypothetical protein EV178_000012 [Coemansia sp. RSA 1646]KAJ1772348.1 hypothetical protein LPJ74_001613 [Coemansia sp. RSA 1843]KAJ2093286.1 hypothetical protein IW138_000579 [Coemansia sp. RSA 986]KAJ2213025.1 hypothetical protein EV179_004173 [Coemansia sp. RSA 487]KAJ2573540.1 hypothetical protein IW140_000182 [Coemansia sp. RSA 1813]
MQANTKTEKAEIRRVMWSPYPDHYLTLWAMPLESEAHMYSPSKKYSQVRTVSKSSDVTSRQRRIQWWQVSRDFKLDDDNMESRQVPNKRKGAGTRGKTTEVLASHRLNFGNQSIRRLSIPVSSVPLLSGLVELRMPQNKLTRLPESLFMLTQLEILNLENNNLDERNMPDHLWRRLVNLRVLFLAGNRFRQLPPSLGRMPRLFYLDVCDNHRLTHLPVELLASPSIGTLAANRCSAELAEHIDLVCGSGMDSTGDRGGASPIRYIPLLEMAPGSIASQMRVPPLAGMCVRQIHLAIGRNGSKSDEEKNRLVTGACERIRRNPSDYIVSSILLGALDSIETLALCSVCDEPVFYPSFSIARQVETLELPVSWHCCSAKCRDKAATMSVIKTSETVLH